MDRVADFESVGRGFEPLRARHMEIKARKKMRVFCSCNVYRVTHNELIKFLPELVGFITLEQGLDDGGFIFAVRFDGDLIPLGNPEA